MATELILNAAEQTELKRLLERLQSELLLHVNNEGWEDCRDTVSDDLVQANNFLHKISPTDYKVVTREDLDVKYGSYDG